MDYFERKLDNKNRLTIPVEIQPEFTDGEAVITRGFDNCLHLYPQDRWQNAVEPALQGDILSEENFRLNRQLRQGKSGARLDHKQGRVIIEGHLLEFAGIASGGVVAATRIASKSGPYWSLEAKK